MSLQQINLGTVANDGTGDDIRTAFQKIISNFNQLDARTPEATTVVNLGNGQGVFASKDDAELRFKTIVGGQNVTLTATGETITVDVNAGVTQFSVEADSGSVLVTENSTIKIEGGRLVTTQRTGNSIVVNTSALGSVVEDESPELGGNLNANGKDIGSVNRIDAAEFNGFFLGNLVGRVHDIDIRDINFYRVPDNSWDFNGIVIGSVTNFWDYKWATLDVDLGTITGNGTVDIDSNSATFGQYIGSNTPTIDFGTINVSP
jgi:hypothetical protein